MNSIIGKALADMASHPMRTLGEILALLGMFALLFLALIVAGA